MIYTLDEIVREKLIEEGRSTLHKYKPNLSLAVRGVRDLNLNTGGQVKTVIISPTTYNTIPYPNDYFAYSKIGVCIGGIIYNLARNPNMCFPHMRDACGQLQPENWNPNLDFSQYQASAVGLDNGWVYWAYTAYNELGEFQGRLYGQGSGTGLGFFNESPENREFVLSPNLQAQSIVLEYVPTVINNALILVPDTAIEALISFVNWKAAKGPERVQYEREYDKAVQNMLIVQGSFTLDDMINAIRGTYSMSPKG